MDKVNGLCVFFLLGVASACERNPSIFITPLKLEGLKGSCLLIPCNFTVKEGENFPGLSSSAVWIKTRSQFGRENSEFVVYNSSRTSENYPMKIIGDLTKKNCTTVFNDLKTEYKDKYFFRVEDGSFRSTASCDPIDITVRDSAWSPSIEVSGDQTEREEVTITCSAFTPCPQAPPTLTWDLPQGTVRRMENSDGTFNTTVTIKLTLRSSHDGFELNCSAEYPVKNEKKIAMASITLNVTRVESGEAGDVAMWLPIVCVLLIAVISGIVYIWHVKFRRPKLPPVQVQTMKETIQEDHTQNEDGLHYGDISFNHSRSKADRCAQDETVYSQVKVSDKNNHRKATEMTDIYAQVKK